MTSNWSEILIYGLIAGGLAVVIAGASYIFAVKKPNPEKVGVYECGFAPYSDTRIKFEVRFVLIAILFIIFDLELSFLFPWTLALETIESLGYWVMTIFIFILTVGLVYEFNTGGIEWE